MRNGDDANMRCSGFKRESIRALGANSTGSAIATGRRRTPAGRGADTKARPPCSRLRQHPVDAHTRLDALSSECHGVYSRRSDRRSIEERDVEGPQAKFCQALLRLH